MPICTPRMPLSTHGGILISKCSLCEGGYGTKINKAMNELTLPTFVIAPFTKESVGADWGNASWTSAAWPAANRAMFIPFRVKQLYVAQQIFTMNGSVLSGNMDLGVYTHSGRLIASTGVRAQAGMARVQAFSLNFQLSPGEYYLAMSMDNTTATVFRRAVAATNTAGVMGILQQSSAFPLPATMGASFLSTTTNTFLVGITSRTFI